MSEFRELWLGERFVRWTIRAGETRNLVPKAVARETPNIVALIAKQHAYAIEVAFDADSPAVQPYVGKLARSFTAVHLHIERGTVAAVRFVLELGDTSKYWLWPLPVPFDRLYAEFDAYVAPEVGLLVRDEPRLRTDWKQTSRDCFWRPGSELVAISGPFASLDKQLALCGRSVVRVSTIDHTFEQAGDKWVEEASELCRFRWPFVSRFIRELMLGLGGVLPPYVVLEILDWLDASRLHTQLTKIRYIEGVHHSIRRVCSKENRR